MGRVKEKEGGGGVGDNGVDFKQAVISGLARRDLSVKNAVLTSSSPLLDAKRLDITDKEPVCFGYVPSMFRRCLLEVSAPVEILKIAGLCDDELELDRANWKL